MVSSSTCLRLQKNLWQRQTSLGPCLGLLVLLGQPAPDCSWVQQVSEARQSAEGSGGCGSVLREGSQDEPLCGRGAASHTQQML